jgi:hypothetical protein
MNNPSKCTAHARHFAHKRTTKKKRKENKNPAKQLEILSGKSSTSGDYT